MSGAGKGAAVRLGAAALVTALGIACVLSACDSASIPEGVCTYEEAIWNAEAGRVIETRTVRHSRAELTAREVDPLTGCTVCSQDQESIALAGLTEFRVCKKLAPAAREALSRLMDEGVPILSVRGYEVVRSRGGLDSLGNRTDLSNHSFGAALDINRELNGLYDDCVEFGPGCRLLLGGRYWPGEPGTLVANGPVVQAMEAIGFRWGGEIRGRQKDFMHFSLTGY